MVAVSSKLDRDLQNKKPTLVLMPVQHGHSVVTPKTFCYFTVLCCQFGVAVSRVATGYNVEHEQAKI